MSLGNLLSKLRPAGEKPADLARENTSLHRELQKQGEARAALEVECEELREQIKQLEGDKQRLMEELSLWLDVPVDEGELEILMIVAEAGQWLSIVEIAAKTRRSRAEMEKLLLELIEKRLIREAGGEPPQYIIQNAGRRAIHLAEDHQQ